MGKVRVKTIGIEEDEKDQKKKAAKRAEKKRIEAEKKLGQETKAETAKRQSIGNEKSTNEEQKDAKTTKQEISSPDVEPKEEAKTAKESKEKDTEEKPGKKEKKTQSKYAQKGRQKKRSVAYQEISKQLDKNKKYTLAEALKILQKEKREKFDETVELHINTHEKGISGTLTLPNGTGKKAKIEIADHAGDPKHLEELVKKIDSGNVDFDILIATPDSMSHLARVARVLGPKGLMPNPKNGTIHPKPKEAAKKFEGGQINFKTEVKAPIMHLSVGKISFEEKQLADNVNAVLTAVKTENIKNITLKSTMSPGIKIQI